MPDESLIAGGHPATVGAAAEVLDAGGNAYDAIVAGGFAAAVAEPGLTSLGGGGFLLARTAAGDEALVDFFVDTPGRGRATADLEPHFTPVTIRFRDAEQVFHAGYGSVAVPGCLAGYLHAHERWGRLGLDRVTAPAQRLATDGVVLNRQQGEIFGLLEDIFTLTPEGRALFAPRGSVLREGDVFTNPELATFLGDLASGRADGFPVGPIVQAMDRHHGILTADDLARYQVVERPPLDAAVPGAQLLTNPAPSFGGGLVVRALALAGPVDLTIPDDVAALAGALVTVDEEHRPPGPRSVQGTTHLSIADADGNLAAMTTSNGSCSGVLVPGTGVQLNNIMGEDDLHPDGFHSAPPGLRVGSMMAPTLLTLASGARVALGSGGSERIRSALTLTIARLTSGAPLREAIEAPRLHWDGSSLQLEPGWDPAIVARLASSWPVNVWTETNLYFGGVHAVSTTGELAGDPRRGGTVARAAR